MGYSSDVTDTQWAIIEVFFSGENRGKHLQTRSKQDLVNAVLYLNKTGCQWRLLPKDFPPYATVWSFYRKTFENIVLSLGKTVKISEKIKPMEWAVLPQRWVVERTLSWLNNSRRLSKDYEISTVSEENMVMIPHLATLLRRF